MIVLIAKSKKPKTVKDYRPISLLCSDYKILTKILASRLKSILSQIVEENQILAAAKGNIQDLLSLVRDVVLQCKLQSAKSHAVINLDFANAFDRVSHKYLFYVMNRLGFQGQFVNSIVQLYRNAQSKVMVNGFMSAPIPVCNSVRQGCPLSMLLFAIALEPLIRLFKKKIEGLRILNTQITSAAYADDINLFVDRQHFCPGQSLVFSVCVATQKTGHSTDKATDRNPAMARSHAPD